eukprot:CAMPEP_0168463272 /NCGR_PEP_ID=MMETSP0228-20121227/54969_1 /TAXON_ID=133427 /ORGANISM="Protoceratium reticulatum, Strain CCCM 535 (=CCMP 1889)" /LENGTH=266 /DNA_ID=CAMNT_0008478721 /DNA_START=78 /DNA_END=875 /DNA_ORIENTATION=+
MGQERVCGHQSGFCKVRLFDGGLVEFAERSLLPEAWVLAYCPEIQGEDQKHQQHVHLGLARCQVLPKVGPGAPGVTSLQLRICLELLLKPRRELLRVAPAPSGPTIDELAPVVVVDCRVGLDLLLVAQHLVGGTVHGGEAHLHIQEPSVELSLPAPAQRREGLRQVLAWLPPRRAEGHHQVGLVPLSARGLQHVAAEGVAVEREDAGEQRVRGRVRGGLGLRDVDVQLLSGGSERSREHEPPAGAARSGKGYTDGHHPSVAGGLAN